MNMISCLPDISINLNYYFGYWTVISAYFAPVVLYRPPVVAHQQPMYRQSLQLWKIVAFISQWWYLQVTRPVVLVHVINIVKRCGPMSEKRITKYKTSDTDDMNMKWILLF